MLVNSLELIWLQEVSNPDRGNLYESTKGDIIMIIYSNGPNEVEGNLQAVM